MPVSKETLEKLKTYNNHEDRQSHHAQAFISEIEKRCRDRKEQGETTSLRSLKPAQENLLAYFHRHKNTYIRVNTLVYIVSPNQLSILPDEREVVDIQARAILQTSISNIKRHLQSFHLELRTIQLPKDRRIKAYGLFDSWQPDTSAAYIKNAQFKRLVQDYKP